MSPEALDAHVNLSSMESFKQIDVYALSLVMWEVLSRCYTEGGLLCVCVCVCVCVAGKLCPNLAKTWAFCGFHSMNFITTELRGLVMCQ